MSKITLTDLGSTTGLSSTAVLNINNNNAALETAIENTLSRDGTSPNAMQADFDMNDNDILNVGNIDATAVDATTVNADTLNVDTIFIDGTELDVDGITGPHGPQGPPGANGSNGTPGVGVPTGGTTGQVLSKIDNTDYNTQWVTSSSLTDGDKGDIVVASSGTVWTLDSSVVTAAAKTVLDDATVGAMLTTLGGQPLDADLTSWAGVTRASGFDTFATTPTSANLRSLLTDESGTGAAYFAGGDIGTPSAGVLTNATGLPISTGVSGLGTGVATFLATPSSANLASALTDETGTAGSVVFSASPALTGTPTIGGVNLTTELVQNSQSAAYTLVLGDANKHIYHPSADTTARTWTIPANASVAYPIGTTLTFINDTSGGVITIAINSDTLVLAGAGTTGSRSLAANGIATAVKMTSTRWIINGTGLT